MKASYNELQSVTGIHFSKWSIYFSGQRSPNLDTLEQIAEKLRVQPGDLTSWFLERRRKHCQMRQDQLKQNQ